MGAVCTSGDGSLAYASSRDPSASLNPAQLQALVVEKLRLTLFSGLLSQIQLEQFAHFFMVKYYPADACIIKRGSSMDAFYIVGEGAVRMEVGESSPPGGTHAKKPSATAGLLVSPNSSSMGAAVVASTGAHHANGRSPSLHARNLLCFKQGGEYFCEGLFVEGSNKTNELNVTTAEETMLLVLTKQQYIKYIKAYPEMEAVVRSIAESMEKQLSSMEFFKGISTPQLKMLAQQFNFVALPQDEVLFHEDEFNREAGNSLYFLFKGKVQVSHREKKRGSASQAAAAAADGGSNPESNSDRGTEEKVLNILSPGCFFGEVGLMMDIPRTATIKALESCMLLELSSEKFRHFITIVPEILNKFNAVLCEYNIHLRYFIHNPLVLQSFMKFCSSEFSTENIDFFLACREFRKLVDPDEIRTEAMRIKHKYIGATAEQQVNLKGSVESKLLKALSVEGPISNTVFIDAEDEILSLMSSDSFGRFKNSDMFKTCIETVNSPWTAILRKLYLL